MRVRLLVVQQMTAIRMAVNCAARAMNCHLTNTPVIGAAFVRTVVTAKSRLRRHHYLSHGRRHWHHQHHPDHQYLDPIHRDQ